MDVVAEAKSSDALDATILRSLWGNQADLSLSAGEVAAVKGGAVDSLVSDHRGVAVELLSSATDVIVVLDNHGLEARVSDVTQKDVPEVLQWLEPRLPVLAERLKQSQADGRLRVKAHDFYTGGRAFWELPQDLQEDYAEAVVILKGDANYRRLLGDLHWPYDTDFVDFARSFWKGILFGISVT
ncbi:Damage-control phosphatase SPAC806.04c (Sugar phosphate phosphatase SPAC806.04c) [Durusdinium trenchii]|uniref:Sugar phosphate phosphatase n=1 Tax=Durusdinium trenchii TaxID=1381693 RepID=A0ABP0HAZ2_9DINO